MLHHWKGYSLPGFNSGTLLTLEEASDEGASDDAMDAADLLDDALDALDVSSAAALHSRVAATAPALALGAAAAAGAALLL